MKYLFFLLFIPGCNYPSSYFQTPAPLFKLGQAVTLKDSGYCKGFVDLNTAQWTSKGYEYTLSLTVCETKQEVAAGGRFLESELVSVPRKVVLRNKT